MSILKGISEAGSRLVGYLTRGVKEGLSANSILEALQKEGLGYRRTTFLSDIRTIKGAETVWSGLRYVRKDYTPDIRHYLETKSPLTTNYQTVMEVRGFNTETGEDVIRNVTIGRDTLVSRGQLEEDALETMEETSPHIVIDEVLPIGAKMSPYRWEV